MAAVGGANDPLGRLGPVVALEVLATGVNDPLGRLGNDPLVVLEELVEGVNVPLGRLGKTPELGVFNGPEAGVNTLNEGVPKLGLIGTEDFGVMGVRMLLVDIEVIGVFLKDVTGVIGGFIIFEVMGGFILTGVGGFNLEGVGGLIFVGVGGLNFEGVVEALLMVPSGFLIALSN